MSNLSLPTMTYAHLSQILPNAGERQIAYATRIARGVDAERILVLHHSSVIAELTPESVYVTNAGYESSTTANRLRQILRDNDIPWTVRIRNYSMVIARNFAADWSNFTDAAFTQTRDDQWVLA